MDTIPSLSCARPDLHVNSEAFLENNYAYFSDGSGGLDVDALDLDNTSYSAFPPSTDLPPPVLDSRTQASASASLPTRLIDPTEPVTAPSPAAPGSAALAAIQAPVFCAPLPHMSHPLPSFSRTLPLPITAPGSIMPISASVVERQGAASRPQLQIRSMQEIHPSVQASAGFPRAVSSLSLHTRSTPVNTSAARSHRMSIAPLSHMNTSVQRTLRKVRRVAVDKTDATSPTCFNDANSCGTHDRYNVDRDRVSDGIDDTLCVASTKLYKNKFDIGTRAATDSLRHDNTFTGPNKSYKGFVGNSQDSMCRLNATKSNRTNDSSSCDVERQNPVPKLFDGAGARRLTEITNCMESSIDGIADGGADDDADGGADHDIDSGDDSGADSGANRGAYDGNGEENEVKELQGSFLPRRAPRKRAQFKNAQPSNFCHVCTHRPSSSDRLVCSSYSDRTCRKIVCRRCLEKQGIKWETEGMDTRCTHCRQNCPPRAQCTTYTKVNQKIRYGRMRRKRRRDLARQGKKKLAVASAVSETAPALCNTSLHDVGPSEMGLKQMNVELNTEIASAGQAQPDQTRTERKEVDQARANSMRADHNSSNHSHEMTQLQARSPMQVGVSYSMPVMPTMKSLLLPAIPSSSVQLRPPPVPLDLPRLEACRQTQNISSPVSTGFSQKISHSRLASPFPQPEMGGQADQTTSLSPIRHPQQIRSLREHDSRYQGSPNIMSTDTQLHRMPAQLLPFVRKSQLGGTRIVGSDSKRVRQQPTDVIDEILLSFLGPVSMSGSRTNSSIGASSAIAPPNRSYSFVPSPHPLTGEMSGSDE